MQRPHHQHVCQRVADRILVTGYGNTDDEHFTELYDPRTNTWVDGSTIPLQGDFRGAKSVKHGEDNVLVLGGFHAAHQLPYIFEYVAVSDSWRARDELLGEARSHFAAIKLPDDVKMCWD